MAMGFEGGRDKKYNVNEIKFTIWHTRERLAPSRDERLKYWVVPVGQWRERIPQSHLACKR